MAAHTDFFTTAQCGYTLVYLTTTQLVDIWVVSSLTVLCSVQNDYLDMNRFVFLLGFGGIIVGQCG